MAWGRRWVLPTSCLLTIYTLRAQPVPSAASGVVDATVWNLQEKRLPLNGHWFFYPNQLLYPNTLKSVRPTKVYVPGLWNDLRLGVGTTQYGTYSLEVVLPDTARWLALDIPQLYSSYNLYVNGRLTAHNGTVGSTRETAHPQWIPQVVSFHVPGDTLRLVLQISNFHHNKGGIRENIYLGSAPLIQHVHRVEVIGTVLEALALGVIGSFFLFLYFRRGRQQIALYLALLCLSFSMRALFSNLYIFNSWVPEFPWAISIRIEYLCLYTAMIWAVSFIDELFREASNAVVRYLLVSLNVCFILFTLITAPATFTKWIELYLMATGLTLLYAVVVLIYSLLLEKAGAWHITAGIVLGIILSGYDVIAYEGLLDYSITISSLGYIIIFCLLGAGALVHLDMLANRPAGLRMRTWDDRADF